MLRTVILLVKETYAFKFLNPYTYYQSKIWLSILTKDSITVAAVILFFLITSTLPYEHQQYLRFTAEAGEVACIEYDDDEEEEEENTIVINCNASFQDVVQAINDPEILENLGNGEYLLKANLEVADGITFEMTSSNGSDGLQYLKIAGENGIIVYGKIVIDGVKITSWDVSEEDVIWQDLTGTIRRGYIHFAASEGSRIINSEFGY